MLQRGALSHPARLSVQFPDFCPDQPSSPGENRLRSVLPLACLRDSIRPVRGGSAGRVGSDGSEDPSEAARKRAAVEIIAKHERALRQTARRYSLCAADAEDAYQRGLEILLTKAPAGEARELIRWMQTVVKHEALAVRRNRERLLAGTPASAAEEDSEDWVALIPAAGRRARGAGGAAGRNRPQSRGAAGPQAGGAESADPARRGLLVRRDQRADRLYGYESKSLPGGGTRALPRSPLAQPGRQPLQGIAAPALGFLRRRGERQRGGRGSRAPAGLRPAAAARCAPTEQPRARRRRWLRGSLSRSRSWNASTMHSVSCTLACRPGVGAVPTRWPRWLLPAVPEAASRR